jgi:hypothetical protein
LRENLSRILEVDTNLLWVVKQEDGIIYDDEYSIVEMKRHQNTIEIVVGNSNRIVQEPIYDVISKKFITVKSEICKMSCSDITSNGVFS